jgi:AraC-like DNA-binding protein
MIAIPLPFVVALLLSILAVVLFIRRDENTQPAFVFIALCALTTTLVGLRWTFDFAPFRLLQPVLAACIPVTAWYCFSSAHKRHGFRSWHLLPPVLVALASLTHPFWRPPIDPVLTLLYLGYGIALLRASYKSSSIPEQVRLSDIDRALKAERIAGYLLLLSACIDGALAIDFSFFSGAHVQSILSIGHAFLLPLLAGAVIMISLSIAPGGNHRSAQSSEVDTPKDRANHPLTDQEAKDIVNKIDSLLTSKELFLDPDLTLDRLARRACIPARQISAAINQLVGRNVSQVVNEYRIERAKQLLVASDKSITQVYLDSGFQTKSNFNREFTRVTQQTPSGFRREHRARA